jgi:hypothetical protein
MNAYPHCRASDLMKLYDYLHPDREEIYLNLSKLCSFLKVSNVEYLIVASNFVSRIVFRPHTDLCKIFIECSFLEVVQEHHHDSPS